MVTGGHGVRMRYDYRHDIAGSGAGVAEGTPRRLRLTRSGDTVTGHESADGTTWTEAGAVRLPGLPRTVRVGLFAASPRDPTLRRTGLGGATEQVCWTQVGGTFDRIALRGAAAGGWSDDAVGERNRTDWEKGHLVSGAVERNGAIIVTGAGDIGLKGAEDGARPVERTLGAWSWRCSSSPWSQRGSPSPGTGPGPRTTCRPPVPGSLLRRPRPAILVAVLTIAVPYAVTSVPLLPDGLAQWLLRVTPAAGFAVQQTLVEHPRAVAHYAPSTGYFPLPWWAGITLLCAHTAMLLGLAPKRLPRGDGWAEGDR
ncbi:hypothetical protein ACWDXD_07195 [Streptomyces sp. NPDC003314]